MVVKTEMKVLTSAIVFQSIMGFLLNMGGYMTYTLISPISFATGLALLTVVIVAANTPLAKGVAMAAFAGWLLVFIISVEIPMPSPWREFVFAVITVPTFISLGMVFLEYGKG